MDELLEPELTVKIIGNQWYWSYELSELNQEYDSYMKTDNELLIGEYHNLTVDNELILPLYTNIRF